MKTEEIDKLFTDFYEEETPQILVPDGLEDRLSHFIDELNTKEKSKSGRKIRIIIGSVAASVAVIFSGIHFYNNKSSTNDIALMKSTVDNPYEASMEVKKALGLISSNFNKGLEIMDLIEAELKKTNETVNKTLIKIKQ